MIRKAYIIGLLLAILLVLGACAPIAPAPAPAPVPTPAPGPTPRAIISYTGEDFELLATVIASEAGSVYDKGNWVRCTNEERAAVGWTVINRLRSGAFGQTIKEVVTAPGQYAHNQEPTSEIKELVRKLLMGQIPDATGGATHFFSPIGMPKDGESTTGFDIGGGLHEVPGIANKVYFPSWTTESLWVGDLDTVRVAYFMFYRTETPAPTPAPKPTTAPPASGFELTEFKAVASYHPSLQIKYTVTDDSEAEYIYLLDASGLELDHIHIRITSSPDYVKRDEAGVRISHFTDEISLSQDPHENLYGVQRKLVVEDWQHRVLFTKNFTFEGPDVVIKGVSMSMISVPFVPRGTRVSITLKNQGDLPAYIYEWGNQIIVNDEPHELWMHHCYAINPHEQYVWEAKVSAEISPGEKTIALTLRDWAGNIVCTYSSSVIVEPD